MSIAGIQVPWNEDGVNIKEILCIEKKKKSVLYTNIQLLPWEKFFLESLYPFFIKVVPKNEVAASTSFYMRIEYIDC